MKKKSAKIVLLVLMLFASTFTVFAYDFQFADTERKVPLRWRNSQQIKILLSNSLKNAPNIKENSDVAGAIKRSLAHWERAANIKFVVSWSDKQSISDGKGDGINLLTIALTPENTAIFNQEGSETAANTRTFYKRTGELVEADIALSPFYKFSTDGTSDTFDLEAVLTHEIGHLLGLDHSQVLGATMAENQGKNGVFALPGFAPRTLSEDDKAAIRAIYGANPENENCCGKIAGIISDEAKKPVDATVWLEEAASGRVAVAVETNKDGSFSAEGLNEGIYRVFAQPNGKTTDFLGEVAVESYRTANLSRQIKTAKTEISFNRVGFNAQLSTIAVPLNAGKSYQVFVAGNNLEKNDFAQLKTSSPYLRIIPESVRKEYFDAEYTVLSFTIQISPNAPKGEYSLYLQKTNRETISFIGVLTVDEVPNDYQSYSF